MPTAVTAARATFKLESTVTVDVSSVGGLLGGKQTVDDGSMGTAFVVDEYAGRSIFATAGHMCESSKVMETVMFGDLPIISTKYVVTSIDGEEFNATVVLDDDVADICIMSVDERVARPLKIADHDVPYGIPAYYVGAPGGFWPEGGIAPIFFGLYSGHEKNGDGVDKILATVWGEGGASGSEIFVPGQGIVGILTQNTHAHDGGGNVTMGPSWRELRKDLAVAKKILRAPPSADVDVLTVELKDTRPAAFQFPLVVLSSLSDGS